MKRLITLVMTLTGLVCLNAQDLPMVVLGDVFVGNTNVKSLGAVHVKPLSNALAGRILNNEGDVTVDDSIIIYSNPRFDGLIVNKNNPTTNMTATTLTVRKEFEQQDYDGQQYVCLPFDAKFSEVKTNISGHAVWWDDYWAKTFDPDNRAYSGRNDHPNNWEWSEDYQVRFGVSTNNWIFEKGLGYRIGIQPDGWTAGVRRIDFNTSSPAEMTAALSKTNNSLDLQFFAYSEEGGLAPTPSSGVTSGAHNHSSSPPVWKTAFSIGWNFIGGLNVAAFNINEPSRANESVVPEFDNAPGAYIYYPDNTSGSTYGEMPLSISGRKARVAGGVGSAWGIVISPFTPFYFQTDSTQAHKKFTYNHSRYDVKAASPATFRSSSAVTANEEMLVVRLYDADNANDTKKIGYVVVHTGDQYSETFIPAKEDAASMNAFSNTERTGLWMIDDRVPTEVIPLMVSSVPNKENRIIKLGVNFPAAGRYVFSKALLSGSNIKSVTLYDKTIDKKINLLLQDYTVDVTSQKCSATMYELILNGSEVISGINNRESNIYAFTQDGMLRVKNLNVGDKLQIVDIAGRVIAAGVAVSDEFSTPVSAKGAYIVTVKGEKPSVLKVLNK